MVHDDFQYDGDGGGVCRRWKTTITVSTTSWRYEMDTRTVPDCWASTVDIECRRTSSPPPTRCTSSSYRTLPCRKAASLRSSLKVSLRPAKFQSKQGVALTERGHTGPPCSQCRPPDRLRVPDYKWRRRQTPTTVTSLAPYTICRRASNKYVGPYCRTEMYAGRIACCPLVGHGEYADRTDE